MLNSKLCFQFGIGACLMMPADLAKMEEISKLRSKTYLYALSHVMCYDLFVDANSA